MRKNRRYREFQFFRIDFISLKGNIFKRKYQYVLKEHKNKCKVTLGPFSIFPIQAFIYKQRKAHENDVSQYLWRYKWVYNY